MNYLTKDQILDCNDLTIEKVECPEWGGNVFVKNMSGINRDKFECEFANNTDAILPNIRAKLACLTVCDAEGVLLFEYDDVEKLGLKNCAPLDRIFDVAMRINKISASDVEELEKK